VPWDVWEAQVAVASLVKSVLARLADRRLRVAAAARRLALCIAHAHVVGFNALCKALFVAVAGGA
jgi:hypothetical protein